MSTGVVIAEDHALFRSGLKQLLRQIPELKVLGEAGDGLAAVEVTVRMQPDLLLLDLSMPGRDGLEVIERVKKEAPRTRILVISMHAAAGLLRAAFRAGAHGYLLKTADSDEFLFSICSVLQGNQYVSAELTDRVVEGYLNERAPDDESPLDKLTLREREVLKLVAEGHPNKSIAAFLNISEKTVDSHRTNFMRKLALHNAREVTMFALHHGLISIRSPEAQEDG